MVTGKTRASQAMSGTAPELALDDASLAHAGEWILLKITREDEGVITHGIVICHHRHRGRTSQALRRLGEYDPEAPVYIFVGGTRRPSPDELHRIMDEAAHRDYVNARW